MNNRKTFQRIFWTIDWRHNTEHLGIQLGDTQNIQNGLAVKWIVRLSQKVVIKTFILSNTLSIAMPNVAKLSVPMLLVAMLSVGLLDIIIILRVIMLSVIMRNVIKLSFTMLRVIVLHTIMVNVIWLIVIILNSVVKMIVIIIRSSLLGSFCFVYLSGLSLLWMLLCILPLHCMTLCFR